jgi:hypothetical protein
MGGEMAAMREMVRVLARSPFNSDGNDTTTH